MILDFTKDDYIKAIQKLTIKADVIKEEYLSAIGEADQNWYLEQYQLCLKRLKFLKENLEMIETIKNETR